MLKTNRDIQATDISYFMDEVAERGVVVVVDTAGSGVALDDENAVVTVADSPSGAKPIGLLLNDFVADYTNDGPQRGVKHEQIVGEKATLLTKGWIVTDQIDGTPSAGQFAVLSSSGTIAGVDLGSENQVTNPVVGRFRSGKDEDGYAKVYIDL